jgi:hypothetical protein
VVEQLLSTHHPLLPSHALTYSPMPLVLLEHIVDDCVALPRRLVGLGQPGPPLVVSLSFVGAVAEKIYWDLAWQRDGGGRPASSAG